LSPRHLAPMRALVSVMLAVALPPGALAQPAMSSQAPQVVAKAPTTQEYAARLQKDVDDLASLGAFSHNFDRNNGCACGTVPHTPHEPEAWIRVRPESLAALHRAIQTLMLVEANARRGQATAVVTVPSVQKTQR